MSVIKSVSDFGSHVLIQDNELQIFFSTHTEMKRLSIILKNCAFSFIWWASLSVSKHVDSPFQLSPIQNSGMSRWFLSSGQISATWRVSATILRKCYCFLVKFLELFENCFLCYSCYEFKTLSYLCCWQLLLFWKDTCSTQISPRPMRMQITLKDLSWIRRPLASVAFLGL